VALQELGFAHIDAFDISLEMLERAKARNVYGEAICGSAAELSKQVSTLYDAVVCVGALNFGHIAPESLTEFVNVTKPNGYVCFSTREDYYTSASRSVQERLESEDRWRLVECRIRTQSIRDMKHLHWLYQVLE
jgi:SAM-dependent methyltransferase